MQKFYCYVDESGQDTHGRLFVVAVVVTAKNRDTLLTTCEGVERSSGKHKDKWGQAKHQRRMRYLESIIANKDFKDALRFATFAGTTDFDSATLTAICRAVLWQWPTTRPFTTYLYVDGLTKTKRHEYGARLRHQGLSVRQVRGIARDESNALTRLADAVAGFVHDALDGRSKDMELFERAKRRGVLRKVG